MATVYVETTIPSYYFETRQSARITAWREATRDWWRIAAPNFELRTSSLVLAELTLAPPVKSAAALLLLKPVQLLEISSAINDLARYYVEHKLMPAEAGGDASHLAAASYHGCDFLLTWNCRHLANANKARHLAILNARLGLAVPIITTPLSLPPETA